MKAIVTGGGGFLGSFVVPRLKDANYEVIVPRSAEYNLIQGEDVRALYKQHADADLIVHLAAACGGIGLNMRHPGRLFYENIMMGVQLIEEARHLPKMPKFVCVGTVCAYPKHLPVPFKEEAIWDGYPEETNAAYGIAKKALLVQAQAYRQEYDMNVIYLLPVNLYGPRDNFDLSSSHVIPAMIRKFLKAKEEEKDVALWGTGEASREFLYADDAARGIVMAADKYNSPDPVNLGSGLEIKIKDLASLIAELTGFSGRMIWDHEQPDGQPRRCLDTTRAQTHFGFIAEVGLREGITRTVDWFIKSGAHGVCHDHHTRTPKLDATA